MPSLNFAKSTTVYQQQASPHSPTRRKLSLIFFFLGLAISIASCAGYSINYIPTSYEFGLIQVLPPLFWVGFALCLLSLLEGINRDTERVFFIKALLFSVLVWNITVLLLKNIYFWDSYSHIFEATPIMLSGHLPSIDESLPRIFSYYPASFPGYHILLSSIFSITNINPLEFARYYPLFSGAVTFLAIWLFFKTFLPSASYRWALLIAMLANVYMQFHVSPQSVGLICGILTLIALEKADSRWRAVAVLLFAYITISHPTTAFIVLSAAGLAWLLRIGLVRGKKILTEPVPLLVVCWLAWSFLYASPFQQSVAGLVVAAPTAATAPTTGIILLDIIIAEVWNRIYGVFYWAPRMRFIVLGVFAIGSVYYLAHQWLNRSNRRQKLLITYTAFLVAPVIMTLIDITFLRTGQLHDRYFLFFLLVASILLVRLAEGIRQPIKKNAFLLALVFLALFNLTTVYYLSSLFIISDETVSASEFVNNNTSSQVIGGLLVPDLADPEQSACLRRSRFYLLYPEPLGSFGVPSVIVFDDHDRLRYQAWYGIEKYDFYAHASQFEDSLNKLYSNSRYDIYWFEGSEDQSRAKMHLQPRLDNGKYASDKY